MKNLNFKKFLLIPLFTMNAFWGTAAIASTFTFPSTWKEWYYTSYDRKVTQDETIYMTCYYVTLINNNYKHAKILSAVPLWKPGAAIRNPTHYCSLLVNGKNPTTEQLQAAGAVFTD